MLDDLQELSRSYEAENRQAIRRGHQGKLASTSITMSNTKDEAGIPYENSSTHREAVLNQGAEDPYDQGGYSSRVPYTMAGPQPGGYLASSMAEYPPTPAGAYAGPLYPQNPSYAQAPNYSTTSAYPGSARPSAQDSYNPSYDPYGDESPRPSYPAGPRRVDPRAEMRDPRLDVRPDPRGADPRAYAVPDPRLDPRDMRDSRTDPRMMQSYSYPVNSPDVSMRAYGDDYVNASMPMGRGGGTYAPSRVAQTGYDPRESPQLRDAYRHEPIREERRNRR